MSHEEPKKELTLDEELKAFEEGTHPLQQPQQPQAPAEPTTPPAPAPPTVPTPPTPPAPTPEPMEEIRLSTGQVYRGKSKDELLQQLVRAQEHASMTIQDREKQISEMLGVLAGRSVQPQPPGTNQPQYSQQQPPAGFNRDEWFQILNTDPERAFDIMMQRYFESPDPRGDYRRNSDTSRIIHDLGAAQQFAMSNQDYIGTEEVHNLMTEELGRRGYDITPENLELSWNHLKRTNPRVQELLATVNQPPPPTPTGQPTPDGSAGVTSRTPPPPTPPANPGREPDAASVVDKFAGLTTKQMEDWFREKTGAYIPNR